ncbi:MAG: methyltransferase family protein [Acutalibacteraceae bacterium]
MLFKVSALIIMLVFYACYFSKMIMQKKQGIQTDQLGKGKQGFIKFIEVTLKTVTCIVPVVELVSIILNYTMSPLPLRIAGIIIGALGDIVFIVAVVTMADNWRAGVSQTDKTELVTKGIYQISRNPAFLGFDLVYLGVLLMFFNWVLFAITIIAYVLFHLQIVNVEEDFLSAAFKDDYLKYCKKVNRYFGRKIFKR